MEVREKGSATVPELYLVNRSDSMVLVMGGEEVVGGKQNRMVNTSFLIGPKAEVDLAVTCLEQGRWRDVAPRCRGGETWHSNRGTFRISWRAVWRKHTDKRGQPSVAPHRAPPLQIGGATRFWWVLLPRFYTAAARQMVSSWESMASSRMGIRVSKYSSLAIFHLNSVSGAIPGATGPHHPMRARPACTWHKNRCRQGGLSKVTTLYWLARLWPESCSDSLRLTQSCCITRNRADAVQATSTKPVSASVIVTSRR